MAKSWSRARWTLIIPSDVGVEIETENAATWAMRTLIAAGNEGFRPDPARGDQWRNLADRLRLAGVPIVELPQADDGQPGYRLGARVEPVRT